MKVFCENCNEYVEVTIKEVTESFNVKGEIITVSIKKVYCKTCNEEIYDASIEKENDIIIYDAYKEKVGLLTSKQIKSLREKRHLSQSQLAHLLEIGQKDITRYENGSIQSSAINLLLLLISDDIIYEKYFASKVVNKKIKKSFQPVEYLDNTFIYNYNIEGGDKNAKNKQLSTSYIY